LDVRRHPGGDIVAANSDKSTIVAGLRQPDFGDNVTIMTPLMSPLQCLMARCALRLSVRDLASRAGVGVNTVSRFENNGDALTGTIRKMQDILEGEGAVFLIDDGSGEGVRIGVRNEK